MEFVNNASPASYRLQDQCGLDRFLEFLVRFTLSGKSISLIIVFEAKALHCTRNRAFRKGENDALGNLPENL